MPLVVSAGLNFQIERKTIRRGAWHGRNGLTTAQRPNHCPSDLKTVVPLCDL